MQKQTEMQAAFEEACKRNRAGGVDAMPTAQERQSAVRTTRMVEAALNRRRFNLQPAKGK